MALEFWVQLRNNPMMLIRPARLQVTEPQTPCASLRRRWGLFAVIDARLHQHAMSIEQVQRLQTVPAIGKKVARLIPDRTK